MVNGFAWIKLNFIKAVIYPFQVATCIETSSSPSYQDMTCQSYKNTAASFDDYEYLLAGFDAENNAIDRRRLYYEITGSK